MLILQRQVSLCSLHRWFNPARSRPSRIGWQLSKIWRQWDWTSQLKEASLTFLECRLTESIEHLQSLTTSPHQWCDQRVALGWAECAHQEDHRGFQQDHVQTFGFTAFWWTLQLLSGCWAAELPGEVLKAWHLLCSPSSSKVCVQPKDSTWLGIEVVVKIPGGFKRQGDDLFSQQSELWR